MRYRERGMVVMETNSPINENEQLARWLGYEPIDKWNWMLSEPHHVKYVVPGDFRVSNEWAGALLEKLASHEFLLRSSSNEDGTSFWWVEFDDSETCEYDHWRDAVVDAALEIIRRGRDSEAV